jgi:hypothetical protein
MIIRPPVSALRWTTFGSITVERRCGEPLVLLHSNGSMIQDFESSGLVELAATIIGSSFLTVLASAQRPASQRHLDARLPGSIDQARTGAARRFTRHRPALRGCIFRSRAGSQISRRCARPGSRYPTLRPKPDDVAAHDAEIFGPRSMPAKFEGFPKEMAGCLASPCS